MSKSLDLLHLGEGLLKQSQWQEAAEALSAAIREDPENYWAYHHLGDALGRLERLDDAIAAYEQSLVLAPASPWTYQNMGLAKARLGQWEGAESAYRSAIDLDPNNPRAYLYLGETLSKQQRWSESVEAFVNSIRLDAENAWPHHHLGDSLGRLGLLPYAVTAYEQALALAPQNPWTLKNFGNVLLKLGRLTEAVTIYQRSLAIVGDDAEMSLNLGAAFSKLEQWREAEAAYLKVRSLTGNSTSIARKLGGVWLKLGRWELAAEAYKQCVEADPNDAELQRNLGIAVFKLETRKAYLKRHPNAKLDEDFDHDDEAPLPEFEWTAARFGSRVFEVERWMEGLTASLSRVSVDQHSQTESAPSKARLLFILDNDFGELTTVMYLLLGQDWVGEIMVMMPERLFKVNGQAFPGQTFCFESVADIELTVESFKPDVAFLCSGYLYAMHDIFTHDELQGLVDSLSRQACKVITADPFLGVLSQAPIDTLISIDVPDESDLALPAHVFHHLEAVKEEQDALIVEKLTGAERILKHCLHLYPAHVGTDAAPTGSPHVRELGFFNPRLVYPQALTPETGTRPHWVFVLSTTDLDAQLLFEAIRGFTEIVAQLLTQAIAMGRRPIFVAPEKFIRDLAREMRGQEGAELISFCSFTRLTSLLLTAEYAFYWNSVSHTILLRSFNGLPVILFDRGHLVRNVEALYDRVVQWYYQGVEPIYMDHSLPLTLKGLEAATADFKRNAESMVQDFQRAPDPESLLQGILTAPTAQAQ